MVNDSGSGIALSNAQPNPLYIPPSETMSDISTLSKLDRKSALHVHSPKTTSFSTFTDALSSPLAIEGYAAGAYLSLNVDEARNRWQRFYFAIRDSKMMYYKDKKTFDDDPKQALNQRPVELTGYRLLAGSDKAPYLITLFPPERCN